MIGDETLSRARAFSRCQFAAWFAGVISLLESLSVENVVGQYRYRSAGMVNGNETPRSGAVVGAELAVSARPYGIDHLDVHADTCA